MKATSANLQRAIFLDRDGTILALTARPGNELHHEREMRILPGAAQAIKLLNRNGFLVFIHTNQAAIARGHLTEKKLASIHRILLKKMREKGAAIHAVYYCPHHPHAIIKKYRVICPCRKPGIGMILQAKKDFGVDLKKSVMVGDSSKDIQAGKRAGMKTILLRTGNGGKEEGARPVKPDVKTKDLLTAARYIIKNYSG